ncbi:hypothetical protein TL18_04960 [Methanobrevibacter sp. YE315]|uniref:hypothetical protein n=1 Tax=Methanobrevibacter sp. YE315 TaxID=1609968 RepID=UPI000764D722|nr:hypothetical protein [Methanobrevibacter sp. YE315]AMD17425.1 hypothetical protein TL18_04960 [Methanobrevibacter sp. YE315]
MKIKEIIITITLLFLVMGATYSANVDFLKAPSGFEDFIAGMSEKTENNNMYLTVDEMEFNKDAFQNGNGLIVEKLDGNIYKYVDTKGDFCGVQEKVKIDGVEYLVYIEEDFTTNGDFNSYLNILKEFNKLNNLEPLAV